MTDSETPPNRLRYVRDEEGGLTSHALFAMTITGAILANTAHLSLGLLVYMGSVGPLDVASAVVGAIGGAIFGGAALLANYLHRLHTTQ